PAAPTAAAYQRPQGPPGPPARRRSPGLSGPPRPSPARSGASGRRSQWPSPLLSPSRSVVRRQATEPAPRLSSGPSRQPLLEAGRGEHEHADAIHGEDEDVRPEPGPLFRLEEDPARDRHEVGQ